MAGEKKYFLGLGGQQSGPFSDDEVNAKITAGEAKADSLIWYDGLGEWQRLDSITFFQAALKTGRAPVASFAPPSPTPKAATGSTEPPDLKPVFSSEEAVFFRRTGPRPQVIVAGIALLLLGAGVMWYLESGEEVLPEAQVSKGSDPTTRPNRLKKADADYLLNPAQIPADYEKLIAENPKDEFGKKAAAELESIYTKRRMLLPLARLMMQLGRPAEAVAPFKEEKDYANAQIAAFKAYELEKDPAQRKAFLNQSIELLTGPLQDIPTATARIRQFEKDFPNEHNPYAYYLLSEEKKMADLFDRTSFFFVENLVAHMKAEFPQVRLSGRPIVGIVREATGKYRITGSYKGEVTLSLDRLHDIRFEYWLAGGDWHLVGTNITRERQEWAKANRTKHMGESSTGPALLVYLEGVMRAQFPKLGLHQKVSREELSNAARDTATTK